MVKGKGSTVTNQQGDTEGRAGGPNEAGVSTFGTDVDIAQIKLKSADLIRRFDRLNAALSEKLLTADSQCKNVAVTVDGHGGLRQISITPHVLHSMTVHELETAILTTVGMARAKARQLRSAAGNRVFADIDGYESPAATLTTGGRQ